MKNNIKKFNEYFDSNLNLLDDRYINTIVEEEYDYITSISFTNANINNDNYFIFMGFNPIFKKPRVKVCNMDTRECIVVVLEDLIILGDYRKIGLNDDTIPKIKRWISLNYDLIYENSLSDDLNTHSSRFVTLLKKI